MKNTDNLFRSEAKKSIGTFSKKKITQLAKADGFENRSRGKIKATILLLSFFKMMSLGVKSYAAWAQCMESIIGRSVSKQAIFERMNSS